MSDIVYQGIDIELLNQHLAAGVDPGGNRIEPFEATDDGWTLRCCLSDASPGDEIAIVAWSPFPWDGPYRETGPIVVHARPCAGRAPSPTLPPELEARELVLRPYGPDRRIAYDRVAHVSRDESVSDAVVSLLGHPDVTLVHGRNVTGGCWAFAAERRESA